MKETLHLFEGYGVELEYMIVNKNNLADIFNNKSLCAGHAAKRFCFSFL